MLDLDGSDSSTTGYTGRICYYVTNLTIFYLYLEFHSPGLFGLHMNMSMGTTFTFSQLPG